MEGLEMYFIGTANKTFYSELERRAKNKGMTLKILIP
jgi:hypothetical protein